MARAAPHGNNQPPKIIIVKKIIEGGHAGHHGGAWKVAYADFVTAMMAFFLLLWLLGATDEKQRRGIADYFAPTLVDTRTLGIGGTGLLGGESALSDSKTGQQAGRSTKAGFATKVTGAGGREDGTGPKGSLKRAEAVRAEDARNFDTLRRRVAETIARTPSMTRLANQVRFVPTQQGMRIDLIDNADYSMFALGTTVLAPEASALLGKIADTIRPLGNPIMIRGHTDAVPYGDPRAMNNWLLSSSRAEATRRRLAAGNLPESRFERIEGVADREPMIAKDPYDPRNRRVAITLLYRGDTSRR
ncbi:MAG TPA: flagellar motor protein MotB [Sphingomonas sp.]|jgi:chemotaxis protein MotB